MPKFKDTMMGKITKGAILSWGEDKPKLDEIGNEIIDESGKTVMEWFEPTEEQANEMLENGLTIGSKKIDYSDPEKATQGKTYGSEIAAIEGLVELISDGKLTLEQKQTIVEQMEKEVYEKDKFSPEMTSMIQGAVLDANVNPDKGTIEVLRTIHDNWVRSNGNNFNAPGREKKVDQFVDLRMMTFDGYGATADLLFLEPILNGAGISLNKETLEAEFVSQRNEYMQENELTDADSIRKEYVEKLAKKYSPVDGLTTTQKKTIEPTLITDVLKDNEVSERLVKKISENVGIQYEMPKDRTVKPDEILSLDAKDVGKAADFIVTAIKEQKNQTKENKEKDGEEK